MSKMKGMDYNHDELYPHTKCLSSSQVLCYEESPAKFFEEYVLGVRRVESMPMTIGKVFSAMFANRKKKFDKELLQLKPKRMKAQLEEALAKFPPLPTKQCEVALKCKHKGWTFRATLDGYIDTAEHIIENKTGQVEWTQERTDSSDQITFQNWVHWKKYGNPAKKTSLFWVNTKSNPQALVSAFKTSRNVSSLKNFEKRVDAVIAGIEAGDWHSESLYDVRW